MPAADGSRASRAAFGGIATALCLIFLAAVRFSPTADLALYSLTSLCIAAVVVEKGVRTATVSWLAASVLSLVFPGFQTSLAFIGFFGFYPLAKAWIEGRKGLRILPAWGLKLLVFNALLAPGGLLVLGPLSGVFNGQVLLDAWSKQLWNGAPPILLLVLLAAQAVFVVYDLALGLLISFYVRRIHPAVAR